MYRSRERLEQEINQFAVIERDGMILACAALYPIPTEFNETRSAEIACVAVHQVIVNRTVAAKFCNFSKKRPNNKAFVNCSF